MFKHSFSFSDVLPSGVRESIDNAMQIKSEVQGWQSA